TASSGTPRRNGTLRRSSPRLSPPILRAGVPSFVYHQLDRLVVLVDLEYEVRADLRTDAAAGAAGRENRVRITASVQLVTRHREHAGWARVDAKIAALARVDVDDHGPASEDAFLAHARTSSGQEATRSRGAVSKPPRSAATFTSTVFWR